jgi:hypothetical protein
VDKQGTLATAGGGTVSEYQDRWDRKGWMLTVWRRLGWVGLGLRLRFDGTVLASHGDIVGPGHMAVLEEESGVYM